MAADLSVYGDTYKVTWPKSIASLTVDGLRDSSWGVEGMVTVSIAAGDKERNLWGPVKVTLTKTGDIMQLGRSLFEQCPMESPSWASMLRDAFGAVLTHWRDGTAPIPLADIPEPDGPRYLISDFLLEHQTTMLAAEGASGKSYFALALAVSVASGIPLLGGRLAPWESAPVLYIDWETDGATQSERVHRICRGLGLMDVPANLHYWRAYRSLMDMSRAIKRRAAELEAGLVIIDSIAPACGAEMEKSDTAIRALNAISELYPATRLVISHLSKANREGRASDATPFGSIFFRELPRGGWTLTRTQLEDSDEVQCALMHTKVNMGKKLAPIAYRMTFRDDDPTAVEFHRMALEDNADLADHASLPRRIIALMRSERRQLPAMEIAELLGVPAANVRTTLNRLKGNGDVVSLGEAKATTWALAASDEDGQWWE